MRIIPQDGRVVEAIFDRGWDGPEKSYLEYWRWCFGSGTVIFRNPHAYPVLADISFGLRANEPVAFQLDGDYLGAREKVRFTAVPSALRVFC